MTVDRILIFQLAPKAFLFIIIERGGSTICISFILPIDITGGDKKFSSGSELFCMPKAFILYTLLAGTCKTVNFTVSFRFWVESTSHATSVFIVKFSCLLKVKKKLVKVDISINFNFCKACRNPSNGSFTLFFT